MCLMLDKDRLCVCVDVTRFRRAGGVRQVEGERERDRERERENERMRE